MRRQIKYCWAYTFFALTYFLVWTGVAAAQMPSLPPSGCAIAAMPSGPVAAGSTVILTLNCASGTQPYTYGWTNSQETTQQISIIAGTTAQYYSACASNAAGVGCDSVLITIAGVDVAPTGCTFDRNPSGPVALGATVTLSLNCASGTQPFMFGWSNNQATTQQLSVVAGTNAQYYSACASNAAGVGCDTTLITTAGIDVPPSQCTLVANPLGPTAVGTTVTLTLVCANGTQPNSYGWTNGLEITQQISVITGPTAQYYSACASNAAGVGCDTKLLATALLPGIPSAILFFLMDD